MAAKILATGQGDARQRAVDACLVLEKLSNIDYQKMPESIANQIKSLLEHLGSAGPLLRNGNTGEVIMNKFERMSYGKRNTTYAKHAEKIFLINEL